MLRIRCKADPQKAEEALIGLALYRADKLLCYGTNTQREHLKPILLHQTDEILCTFSPLQLVAGTYWFDVALRRMDMFAYDYRAQAVRFVVYNAIDETGVAHLAHEWSFSNQSEIGG